MGKRIAVVLLCLAVSGCANFQPLRQYPLSSAKVIYLNAYKDGAITQAEACRACEFFDTYPEQEARAKADDLIRADGNWDAFYVWKQLEIQKVKGQIQAQNQQQTANFIQGMGGAFLAGAKAGNSSPSPQPEPLFMPSRGGTPQEQQAYYQQQQTKALQEQTAIMQREEFKRDTRGY